MTHQANSPSEFEIIHTDAPLSSGRGNRVHPTKHGFMGRQGSRENRKFYNSKTNQAILATLKSLSVIFNDGVEHIARNNAKIVAEKRRLENETKRRKRKLRGLSNAPKSKGWKWIRGHRRNILLYGQRTGIIRKQEVKVSKQQKEEAEKAQEALSDEQYQRGKREKDIQGLTVKDKSLIHSAIPFLPVPWAALCCFFNIFLPGLGTILSGGLLFFCGRPRILHKASRIVSSFFVNLIVGVCQFFTVTFLLVGWFWSIAWGYLMIAHSRCIKSATSVQYREAVLANREEYVAEAALDAFSKGEILRRRNLRDYLKNRKDGKDSEV